MKSRVDQARELSLTEDDVRDFLDERKASLKCEVCGVTDWSIAPDLMIVAYMNVALATCRNCGNMRFHNAIVLKLWKLDREAK